MKVYEYNFEGLWLGGKIIIIAESEEEAFKMAKEEAVKYNKDDIPDLVKSTEIEKGVVYLDDGDY